jgi:ERF superfamily protein
MKPATASIVQPHLPPLNEAEESTALAPTSNVVLMFERLATNPDVNVEKLERLIAMQERILAHNAKAEFDAAFSEMQGEIPTITERGEILVDGVLRSRYAKHEDILDVVKPILKKYGFAIRHRNVFENGTVKIIGILSHRSGHSEQDEFVAKADDSGKKNAIQALGSTRAYGQRYTTIALLNISTRGADDDGATSTKAEHPAEPDGYTAWRAVMESVANEGTAALSEAWNRSRPEFRAYITRHDGAAWPTLKAKAQQVKGSK